jgi:thiamine kinase-like enzyme
MNLTVSDHDLSELHATIAGVPLLRDVPLESWQITWLPGLTNRSFRIQAGGRDYAVRLAGPGTDRYISRAAELYNAGIAGAEGWAPRVIYGDVRSGLMVTQFIADGQTLTASALRDPDNLGHLVHLLRRVHGSGRTFRGKVRPFTVIDRYLKIAPHARIARLRGAAEVSRRQLLELTDSPAPCHVDPSPGNILVSPSRGWLLIDWEYSAMAYPLWDLATVAVESGFGPEEDERLLRAYFGEVSSADRGRFKLYRPMLRLVAAAWANAALASGSTAPGLAEMIGPTLDQLEGSWT